MAEVCFVSGSFDKQYPTLPEMNFRLRDGGDLLNVGAVILLMGEY
jgi:hypothetical protein